jgi:hypothetical protein
MQDAQQNVKSPSVSQPNTIGLEMAVNMTTNWRNYLGKAMGENFRGFLIPFADIQNIMEIHKDKDLMGVRGYMSLADENTLSSVRFILVPVDSDGKDIVDMHVVGDADDDTQSTIYDFTQPCPAFCDMKSPLYSDTNLHSGTNK